MSKPSAEPTNLPRFLTALPVYNECEHVEEVLAQVARYAADILVVDDGSTDCTREFLAKQSEVDVVSHCRNRGYGAALQTAFAYAIVHRYDVLVTIDCDGQHEPQRIPQLVEACRHADIVSGSRYLEVMGSLEQVPADRRRINEQVTADLNQQLGLQLTDAFCGFKAYQVRALAQLDLIETGYAMPLELWVQAAHHKLKIVEMPVPLIYLDESRSFGGPLDDAPIRLKYYREVIERAIQSLGSDSTLPATGEQSRNVLCGGGSRK